MKPIEALSKFLLCSTYNHDFIFRCYARATTMGIHVLAWSGEHNHEVIEHQLQCYDRKYANAYPANDPRSKKIWERPDKIWTEK